MRFIDVEKIAVERDLLKKQWDSKKPFRYLVVENFLVSTKAEEVLSSYPPVDQSTWDGTTYINQKNKFQQREFPSGSVFLEVFEELNSPAFLKHIEYITDIENLIPDEKLFGGGLHQSRTGAFLDVHVDYNIHPDTKHHRRLNIIVYMNKDWRDEYEGHLQLWDMDKKEMIGNIAPTFNRMVMFETNEISFHGHPKPLKSPHDITRKSIAAYYYTNTRPSSEIAQEHNTIYVNTEGIKGKTKNFFSGVKAMVERLFR
jgi:Rps23 Pro-64 3,4-dihydroxylase Tpa1-like proline 4-hydroxylase